MRVIVLSARQGEQHKVAALDAGADDYVTKPYSMPEFLARVRAALRRAAPAAEASVVTAAGFTVDLGAKRVVTPAGEVKLTATEWHVLAALARRPGMLVTQRQLLREVWGPEYGHENQLSAHLSGAIAPQARAGAVDPRHLITEHGKGYRFEP